ncbi:mitochondrial import inner membrane translocase subunit Tim29-like [Mizuhopecten yessoensis]|uniref:Uncharacterized protein C19orf52 n=1 Tax=Mizuhopecten yessoensis TaxID=6573 RepID=A0A210PNX8_MIZYE|nr:mitochondrial import inner membrane translocase subunit Tim29-like [Mizuhopecten yessoensis]OWF38146.1 Uncharacterized protein C19orf52 [Mizuhopecten yessoensis]
MAASGAKFLSRLKPRLPEKWKGGKMEKIANYFNTLLRDYHMVYKETLRDMKDRPLKASVYLSLLATVGVLIKTNPSPSKLDYEARLVENHNDVGVVGVPVRNPESVKFLHKVFAAHKDCKLKIYNLYLLTLARIDTGSTEVDQFASKCKQIKPHWTEFHKSIVDVCIFGRWIHLERAMVDYDVNPSEWENK